METDLMLKKASKIEKQSVPIFFFLQTSMKGVLEFFQFAYGKFMHFSLQNNF